MLGLAVLVYLPVPWLGWPWIGTQACLMASLPMVLPGRVAVAAMSVPVLGTVLAVPMLYAGAQPPGGYLYWFFNLSFTLIVLAAGLYGSARLVRVIDELRATRAELAESAIGRERLRVSRDLHDLLGQTLSAISLKGDLAVRLLHRADTAAARGELESLTGLARAALHGVRAVTQDEHRVSLGTEIDGAAALAAAADIDVRVHADLPEMPPAVERVLGWAVREGITNVLRHSGATTCSITAGRRGETAFVEIVNDRARPAGDGGIGLSGLTERARPLSGRVSAGPIGGGRYRLLVEVPLEAA